GNVGVIGIAVFRERRTARIWSPPRPSPYPYPADARSEARDATGADQSAMAAEAPSAVAPPLADATRQRIGTGHGAREWAPVSRAAFVRASRHPAQVTELRYDTPRRLAALGILPRERWPHRPFAQAPRAFPGGFVPDPR